MKILLLCVFLSSSFAHAETPEKLICDVSYVTLSKVDGRRLSPELNDAHVEAELENTPDLGLYASILKRTETMVDYSVTITGDKIMASLAYGKQQTSYEGPIAAGGFKLSLFYRGGDVLINGDMASSISLECKR